MNTVMKNLLLLGFLLALALTSCNNDLNVNADYKESAIVYGILRPSQDTQWVRIHRSYMGDQGAQGGSNNPDSIYFNQLDVKVLVKKNGSVQNTIQLVRDSTSRELDEGYFTSDGFHLYRFQDPIDIDAKYEIEIIKPDSSLVYGETPIVKNMSLVSPGFNRLNFAGPNGQDIEVTSPENGRIFQGFIRFHYKEQNRFNYTDTVSKYIDYQLNTQYSNSIDGTGVNISQNVNYTAFFGFLKTQLTPDPNVNRFFKSCDIYMQCGADDFATYLNVTKPSSGIVQDRPNFTNLTNGLGIFSSINDLQTKNLDFSPRTYDSLYNGLLLCDYRFGRLNGLDTLYCQ